VEVDDAVVLEQTCRLPMRMCIISSM